ncbi:MAG: class I SAM-dependent methyltransferase [Desulfobacteraceae bacterium]|nr:class I SAM-dependent methyltransferase [Desulfobacteraceae bacterium]
MPQYYDKSNNRLVYIEQKSSPDFWDAHWNIDDFRSRIERSKNNQFILKNTQNFLKEGVILEGGCGMGGNVYCLHHNGYSAFGVDSAKKTTSKINKYFPELNVVLGDVRDLKFDDDFFDAYWSLGVIEHYYEGYEDILKEMKRVIQKKGYVFVTFPYISPLRKFKAKLGLYEKYENNNCDPKNFYQFALNVKSVRIEFEKYGFILEYIKPFDGIKGFKDEVLIIKPVLQKLYDYNGKNPLIFKLRSLSTNFLTTFSAHMVLMIFQLRK